MIKINAIWITFFVIFIASFLLSVVFGLMSTKLEQSEAYSFKRHFPCELHFTKKSSFNSIHNVMSIIFVLASFGPLCLSISQLSNLGDIGVFCILIASISGLCALALGAMTIVEARYTRIHTKIAIAFFTLVFIFASLSAVFAFVIYSKDRDTKILQLIFGIVSAIIALSVILISINPKLKDWARLEAHKNEDGTTSFIRPKVFPLAFSEWLVVLLFVLANISYYIILLRI